MSSNGEEARVRADLVLEGGGAKGIALAGAVAGLAERGVEVQRVAGTSAGSIAAALLAAGLPPDELDQLVRDLDLRELVPPGPLEGLGLIGTGARGLAVLLELGIHDHEPLRTWIRGELYKLGVTTFADLRYDDADDGLPLERRFRLVVAVADVTRGRRVLLPWDYADYGLEPDQQLVADAVVAASSIPLVFEPSRLPLPDTDEEAVLVDGGLLSNFPVDIFDRTDDRLPRWPTIGIKLSVRPDGVAGVINPVTGPISYLRALAATAVTGWDQRHLDDPRVVDRTIFVDTTGVPTLDFGIDAATRRDLSDRGRAAAHRWFDRRDRGQGVAMS